MIYEKIIKEYDYVIKTDTRHRTVVVLKVEDRVEELDKLVTELQSFGYTFSIKKTSFSSFDSIVVEHTKPIVIVLKNKRGMAQTTLNSTITELAPCISLSCGIEPKTPEDLYQLCVENIKNVDVFVCEDDFFAGVKFVGEFSTSEKFNEKMLNAFAISCFLWNIHKENTIQEIKWGYRKKPNGINSTHRGDIFIKQNNEWVGISLKAGSVKSKEPQLNTYVKPILDYFAKPINPLINELYIKVYSKIGCDENFIVNRKYTHEILEKLENTDKELYDYYYVVSLGLIRGYLINTMSNNQRVTLKWILENLCSNSDVDLITLKVFGDKVVRLEDDNIIHDVIKKSNNIDVRIDHNSRQNFEIQISDVVLKMTVRSNKCGVQHKLGQFANMAVKFNGTQ